MVEHWAIQDVQFAEELGIWKQFREYQKQSLPQITRIEVHDDSDKRLAGFLTRINDWREFEV